MHTFEYYVIQIFIDWQDVIKGAAAKIKKKKWKIISAEKE